MARAPQKGPLPYLANRKTMIVTNILEYPFLNRYVSDVLDYMAKHKFTAVPDYQEIELQAERALDAFCDARRLGRSVDQSSEIAYQVLFENIGESEYEVVEKLLNDNFKDTVDLSDEMWVEYWVNRILSDVPDLFENCEFLTYGISAADIDINRDALVGRIKEYYESYGL